MVLLKQRDEFKKNPKDIQNFSAEFNKTLPFQPEHKKPINNKRNLNNRFELCQVLRDIINIGEETNWSLRSPVKSIYRSIGTFISKLSESSSEYSSIKHELITSYEKSELKHEPNVLNIYEIQRPNESLNFMKSKLENVKTLYHGSKVNNFLGILSRGLMIPKNVLTDDSSGDILERSDIGLLGNGIYFADSLSTCIKYTQSSNTKNTRLIAVCEVALGICKDYYEHDYTLTKAPEGFNSTHGVKKTNLNNSMFKDDEFVIYNTNQYRIKYLVELQLNPIDGAVKILNEAYLTNHETNIENSMDDNEEPTNEKDLETLKENLNKNVRSGLKTSFGRNLPLKSVHVRAKIIDMIAKVVIYQEYENNEEDLIEAEYLFPLNDLATVSGFEAFINDKHVIGVCKEKEQAHREYKEAIEQGKGAYLIDQKTSEIFKVNIGNLPPKSKCVIKITYLTELEVQNEQIYFRLPSNVSSWQVIENDGKQPLQTSLITKFINKLNDKQTVKRSSFFASVLMPFEIRSIKSPTHDFKLKKTSCQAVIELDEKIENSSEGKDDTLIIVIEIATIHIPRMLVEDFYDSQEQKLTRACMVSFYPEFEFNNNTSRTELPVLNFLLDCSNSMKENNLIKLAKKLNILMLKHLPNECLFNITIFGTDFLELFPYPLKNTANNLHRAFEFLSLNSKATRGSTDLLNILKEDFSWQ